MDQELAPGRAALLLACVAIVLMLPVMLGPVRLNDSHWINWVWSDQFTALVRQGQLWPRWLPQSHDGLGAPVFYFYGPVAFWLAALAGLFGLGTWGSLVAAATFALWTSGVAMFACLAGSRRRLAGAIVYMVLPYHLLDFAMRGALAEFVAFAVLPLLALGVRRAGGGRIGLLAMSYALLICTHLPTALLASLFLLPWLLWMQAGEGLRALAWRLIGLAIGLGLAAPYLLPALSLQSAASIATMTGTAALNAADWTPFSGDPAILRGLAFLAIVAGASVVIAVPHLRRERWAWFLCVVALLGLGVAPALWSLPLLERVQFPWRLLVLAEFAAAMVVARSSLPPQRLLLLVAPAMIFGLMIAATPPAAGVAPNLNLLRKRHPDVIEYLPPGAGEKAGAWSRRTLLLAARTPPARAADGWTTERRFAFPAWQVRCAGRIVPSGAEPGTGLLRYRGTACSIEQRRTLPETIGILLALLAAAAIAARSLTRRSCRSWPEAPRAVP